MYQLYRPGSVPTGATYHETDVSRVETDPAKVDKHQAKSFEDIWAATKIREDRLQNKLWYCVRGIHREREA